jgi:hypothetical protein
VSTPHVLQALRKWCLLGFVLGLVWRRICRQVLGQRGGVNMNGLGAQGQLVAETWMVRTCSFPGGCLLGRLLRLKNANNTTHLISGPHGQITSHDSS